MHEVQDLRPFRLGPKESDVGNAGLSRGILTTKSAMGCFNVKITAVVTRGYVARFGRLVFAVAHAQTAGVSS